MSARWGPNCVLITDNGVYVNEWDLKDLNKWDSKDLNKKYRMFLFQLCNVFWFQKSFLREKYGVWSHQKSGLVQREFVQLCQSKHGELKLLKKEELIDEETYDKALTMFMLARHNELMNKHMTK